jgi:phosphotransferase system enzyme I (PtsI)
VEINLMANVEKVDDTAQVKEFFAKGIGLFRTEYLYLNTARIPTEQEQFLAYKAVAEAVAPDPVIIRTLDLGGDKPMTHIPELMQRESNPFLGFRAIRFCLETPGVFKDQLRAILKASVHGNVRMMYPMISGVEELERANAMLEECKVELRGRSIPFDEKLEVGAMIEIPSAAVTADLIAQRCDFFSIGTNDLIQYLLAIDRGNDRIAHLYEPTHPAVLRTLKQIIDGAKSRKLSVGVCGEMAGDPVFTPLLLGLGVDSLSMTPNWLPTVKFLVRAMKMSEARSLAKEALAMTSAKEIYRMCDEFYRAHVPAE